MSSVNGCLGNREAVSLNLRADALFSEGFPEATLSKPQQSDFSQILNWPKVPELNRHY